MIWHQDISSTRDMRLSKSVGSVVSIADLQMEVRADSI